MSTKKEPNMARKKTTVVKPVKTEAHKVTEADFETKYDDTHTFPFFEDEGGNVVVGFGHTDRAEFAAAVNNYDALANGAEAFSEMRPYTRDDVVHAYAVTNTPTGVPAADWTMTWHEVTNRTKGAFKITLVQR